MSITRCFSLIVLLISNATIFVVLLDLSSCEVIKTWLRSVANQYSNIPKDKKSIIVYRFTALLIDRLETGSINVIEISLVIFNYKDDCGYISGILHKVKSYS